MEKLAVQLCDFVGQKEPQERKLTIEILGVGMYILAYRYKYIFRFIIDGRFYDWRN